MVKLAVILALWTCSAAAYVAREAPAVLAAMQQQAAAVMDMVRSADVRAFLDRTRDLPDPGVRTVWRGKDGSAYTPEQYAALPTEAREGLTKRDYDATFYYQTGFGSPVIYARPLDLAAEAMGRPLAGAKVLDFGYGMVGQLRMLAGIGCDVHGTDVWPVLPALYAQPGDSGEIKGPDGASPGRVTLHHGRWPAEASVTRAVGEGFDLLVTKNVLKRGYIRPDRPADERQLIRLGVDDEAFVRAMHGVLKPGGVAIIYNLSPAQNPEDKPFLPHADGRCAFPRETFEKAGFEVVAYEKDDSATARELWVRLGITPAEKRGDLETNLFANYTLVRRGK